jgi:hypothetical protein
MEYSPKAKKKLSEIKGAFYAKWKGKFDKSIEVKYGKKAVLISISESERYYSCVDTVTFCKKCAYLMDEKNLLLCREGELSLNGAL